MSIITTIRRSKGGTILLYGTYSIKQIPVIFEKHCTQNKVLMGRYLFTNIKVNAGVPGSVIWCDILEDMKSFMPNNKIAAVGQENELRILPLADKCIGLGEKRVYLDLQKYKTVDLDDKVIKAIGNIKTVLGLSHLNRTKGPLVVIRGVGGGKTLAMASLQRRLREEKGILPVLITFNSEWTPGGEFGSFKKIFSGTEDSAGQTMALVVVSRVMSLYFGVPLDNVVDSLDKAGEKLRLALGEMEGCDITAHFLAFLADMEGAKDVVLLVDETVAAEREFFKHFPDDTRGIGYIRDALLNIDYGTFGLRSALVLSGLKPHISGMTPSGKKAIPFVLSECLNAEAVVRDLFLTDLDADGCLHPIHLDCESPEDGRKALSAVASVLNSLPRGLEMAQDEIRRRVKRENDRRQLTVTAQVVDDVFRGTLENIKWRYPQLASQGLPEPDLLYALLYGLSVRLDDRVASDIARSVFVNSLDLYHVEDVGDANKHALIKLKSSIVSLSATLLHEKEIVCPVAHSLLSLLSLTRQWVSAPLTTGGFMLESLSVAWMRLKLITAKHNKVNAVPLKKLLRLIFMEVLLELADSILRDYLSDEIPTPSYLDSFEAKQLSHSFYDQYGKPNVAVLDELDQIRLTVHNRCVLIKPAPGDCFDYALGYLGKCDSSGQRPYRLIMFDNKSIKELESGLEPVLPVDFTLIQTKHHKAPGYHSLHVKETAVAWSSEVRNQGVTAHHGLGSAVGCGEYIYVYQTTMEGRSYAVGNVLTLGRADTERYFGFMYPPYATAAKRANVDAALELLRKDNEKC